ncbi:ABC transporter F family member 4 like protein [Verticillium longisporum]|uniref:ABC transporter F family member 4 like protein n=1 Tax=Verticillium longisporum TaxID=100787 RepID=A0A8I2ZJQ6_VERLO|nr:ABC transporter F family member 4 like protein [Verticillium longisporum]
MLTSIASESVATILCTSKQTRFDIKTVDYRELDIEGLCITVVAGPASEAASGEPKKKAAASKAKAKARAEGLELLSDAKLRLKAGQRYALVGRNGSGKSTLLKAIAEKLIPGIPEEARISILQQTDARGTNTDAPPPGPASSAESPSREPGSVLEDVIEKATARSDVEQDIRALSAGIHATDPLGSTTAESKAMIEQAGEDISPEILRDETQEALDMMADLQLQVEPTRMAEIESNAKKILTGLGFTDAYMAKPVASLSGGWRMRAALATALLQETDILILDEPTNYLDLLGIIWLQKYLESLDDDDAAPTLILVSHDRDFISVCTDLLIVKDKQLTYFHGDLPTYESSLSEKKLYLTKLQEAQNKQKAHIQQSIQNNMKAGKANDDQNKLRQAKSRQKKLDNRMGLTVSAKGGRFKLNRDLVGYHLTARADIDVPQDERSVSFIMPQPPDLRFPGALLSVENATFRYPTKVRTKTPAPPVLQDVSLMVHMGDRVGILGLNGAGKSTLIRLLVDETKPTSGTVTRHPRLKLGYYSQHAVEALQAMGRADESLTALSLLTGEVEGELDEGELRGLLGSLGLPGRTASDVPLTKLSGGQLVRCELARLLWKCPQCLILDEVTTHLDYETVTAMREALCDWEGAVVLVSHDRWFMRGAVEGQIEDSDDEAEDDSEDEAAPRRRMVYKLRAGKLSKLERGTTEFEESVEKRVAKLLRG